MKFQYVGRFQEIPVAFGENYKKKAKVLTDFFKKRLKKAGFKNINYSQKAVGFLCQK